MIKGRGVDKDMHWDAGACYPITERSGYESGSV
jgi:hypothetical protein